ncbi:MAG: response regulator [Terriglobales bacterium]
MKAPHTAEIVSSPAAAAAAPEPPPQARPRLLLAEDDRCLRKAARTALERRGWETLVACDGEEALAALAQGGVHLVLLDLILPKVNGFEVLERLRQNPATAQIPVIVLTNLGQFSEIQRARHHGAAGYLIKGELNLSEMVARVEAVLAERR